MTSAPAPAIAWLLASDREVPAPDDWLGPDERAYQATLRIARRRREWRLGRWVAKRAILAWARSRTGHTGATALDSELDASSVLAALATLDALPDLARLEIRRASDHAPEPWLDHDPLALTLSISHRAGRALAAIAPAAIAAGCDLERIEPRSDRFVSDFFTADERASVARITPDQRDIATALIWSAKESALKALRQGLSRDTRSVEVTFSAERSIQLPGQLPGDSPGDSPGEHPGGLRIPISAIGWLPLVVTDREGQRRYPGYGRIHDDVLITIAADRPTALPVALLSS